MGGRKSSKIVKNRQKSSDIINGWSLTGLAIEVLKEIMIGARIVAGIVAGTVAGIVAGIVIRKEAIMIQTGIQEVGIVVVIEAGIGELTSLLYT